MNDLVKPERVKTRATFSITTTLDFDDDGYLGAQATVEDHIKAAREKLSTCQFLIKQGATDPKPIGRVKVELLALSLIPKGE